MATVSSKDIVDEIIANNGKYGSDPEVVAIVQYNNQFNGGLAWGLIYEGEDAERYHTSPYCHNPKTIWIHGIGMVNHG
jgi:hypothetical protein